MVEFIYGFGEFLLNVTAWAFLEVLMIGLGIIVHGQYRHFNYCPNCGADMRGDKDGN